MQFRHEIKFEITYSDYLAIRSRLKAICNYDGHTINGKYLIRSLYFDTPSDKALRENLYGVNFRKKFRIRYYNGDLSFIRLEKKSKINGLCLKESAQLTVGDVKNIIFSNDDLTVNSREHLLNELYSEMKNYLLMPKTVVEYTREPYVYQPGNVRITFDSDIRSGILSTDFLNTESVTIPVCCNVIIMEVKWDEFLPTVIRDAVATEGRRAGAFSKYANCRKYG